MQERYIFFQHSSLCVNHGTVKIQISWIVQLAKYHWYVSCWNSVQQGKYKLKLYIWGRTAVFIKTSSFC